MTVAGRTQGLRYVQRGRTEVWMSRPAAPPQTCPKHLDLQTSSRIPDLVDWGGRLTGFGWQVWEGLCVHRRIC